MLERARRLAAELRALHRLAGAGVAGRYALAVVRHAAAVARDGTLAPADAAMRGRAYRFSVDGREVVFDGYSFGVARELYGRRAYFAAPGFRIRPGDAVLDLGANAGLFTVLAARFGARVVAVEGNPACLELIRANIAANDAAGSVSVELALVGGSTGALGGERREALGAGAPPVVPVAELVERHGLERVDFAKIDVEGAEFDILDEEATWLAGVARLAAEIHPEYGDPGRVAAVLRGHGFRVGQRDASLRAVAAIGPPAGFLYAWRD
jgi:FkbM family methyltransferase